MLRKTLLIICVQDFSDVHEDDGWLCVKEREILAGLRFPKRRNDWRLGRWTAKQAIRAFLRLDPDVDLSRFEIRAAADGAPEVFMRNEPAEVMISISHAGGRSFCTAGPPGAALGCDIEQLEPRGELLATDYFTPEETELARSADPENRILVTNLIWSAKESVLKALREGLRRDTRDISIQPELTAPTEQENVWSHWAGRCRQTSREFQGRWRADSRFVYTVTAVGELLNSANVSIRESLKTSKSRLASAANQWLVASG
jgi:4'-phosphopantetheinyl transferase